MATSKRRLGGAFAVALLAIAIGACGGSTPSATLTVGSPSPVTTPAVSVAPEASPSAGAAATPGGGGATTGRIEVPVHGFALTLPAGWTRLDIAAGDLQALIEASNIDPALAERYAAQIQALSAAGLGFFALGPDPTAGTQVMVLATPGGGMSLDLLEQVNTAALEGLAEGDLVKERVTLPAGDALHYRYGIGVEGTGNATLDQYFVLAGDKQFVITATNATEADAKAIANSIEVLD